MYVWLVVGFVMVALASAALRSWGRAVGAITYGGFALVGVVGALVHSGRSGVSDLALGAFTAMPVWIACTPRNGPSDQL
ncbi:MAG: hypothetical protein ACRCXL_04080 [Dermatophilaceae bacterium]